MSLVFGKIIGIGLSITKKQYVDPFLGVSIKIYLLPGFESYTFNFFPKIL
jgi:hypothetical protein